MPLNLEQAMFNKVTIYQNLIDMNANSLRNELKTKMLLWFQKYDHGTSDSRVYQNQNFDSFDKFNPQFNLHSLQFSSRRWRRYKTLHTQISNAFVSKTQQVSDIWFETQFNDPKILGQQTFFSVKIYQVRICVRTLRLSDQTFRNGRLLSTSLMSYLQILVKMTWYIPRYPHLLIPSYDNDCIQIIWNNPYNASKVPRSVFESDLGLQIEVAIQIKFDYLMTRDTLDMGGLRASTGG